MFVRCSVLVFLFSCCIASSDRERLCVGAPGASDVPEVMLLFWTRKELTAVGLRLECSWIKSANDGPPLGLITVALTPVTTPAGCRFPWRAKLRLPNPGGGAREELVVVILGLFNERLLRETESREEAEPGDAADMFKDANVPKERLF